MIISVAALLLLVIVSVGFTRLFSGQRSSASDSCEPDAGFLESFSVAVYRPMLRLASQMDRRYLVSSHGSRLAARHRRVQRELLHHYLRDLSRDFNRLYNIATTKAARALNDSGNLSMVLAEQQMTFILLIWCIEVRLILDCIYPYSVDLQPAVDQIESLFAATRELVRPQFSYHGV